MSLSSLQNEIAAHERRRRLYTFILVFVTAAVIVAGFIQAESMNSGGFLSGLQNFFDYPSGIFRETIAGGWANFQGHLIAFLPALIETLNIAITATIIGGAGALVLSMLSASNLDVWPPLVPVTRRMMDILRAFPELIIALLLVFVFGTNALPAIIAVALHTSGALGKLFSEVNENIDLKQVEGLKAAGASWTQRIRYAVLPQVSPNYLSYLLLRLEINVRASAILGYVGAGGLGAELRRTLGWGQGSRDETLAIFTLLILSIVVIDQLSSYLRARLIGGREAA